MTSSWFFLSTLTSLNNSSCSADYEFGDISTSVKQDVAFDTPGDGGSQSLLFMRCHISSPSKLRTGNCSVPPPHVPAPANNPTPVGLGFSCFFSFHLPPFRDFTALVPAVLSPPPHHPTTPFDVSRFEFSQLPVCPPEYRPVHCARSVHNIAARTPAKQNHMFHSS